MSKHVRAYPLRRDPCVGGHRPNDLEQAHPAEVRLAAREQPRPAGRQLEPFRDRPCARVEIGTSRSFEPLPRTIRNGWSGRTAPRGRPTSSVARRPEPYSSSSRARLRTAANSPLAARSSAASNMRSTSLVSRMRGSGRSRRGRGKAAEGRPSAARHRRGSRRSGAALPSVAQRWRAQGPPTWPQAAKHPSVAERPSEPRLSAARSKIVPISCKRVARGAGFGGHHVEEAIDQGPVVRGHVRDRASAAIIRAVKPWPVRLSAEIAW